MSAKSKIAKSAAGIAGLLASQDSEAAPFGTLARQLGKRTREAWHGSPHVYDQVDLSRMGTGEGAQAYGAGYYAADARGLADDYRRQLSRTQRFDGEPYNIDDPRHVAAYWVDHFDGDRDRALRYLEQGNEALRELGQEVNTGPADVLRRGERLPDVTTPEGALYRLEIPDEDLLDWDAPLSEQPEGVKAAFRRYAEANPQDHQANVAVAAAEGLTDAYDGMTGSDFYARLRDQPHMLPGFRVGQRSDQAASDYLSRMGIPGIRYFDGMSRNAGEGTRNYVIFDDRNVNVVERNGQPVAAMPRGRETGFANPEIMALLGGAGAAGFTGAEAIAPLLLQGERDSIQAPESDKLAQFAELISSAETGLPLYERPFQETGNLLNNIAYGAYGPGFPTSGQFIQDAGFSALEFLDPVSYAALLARKPERKAGGGMTEYKMKPMADALASRGRMGDSMLIHVNPAEVAGIASLAPGGKLTTNPDTGLPEAFLPFLAPILGAVAGKAFLPLIATKLGGAAIGSMMTPAIAGALGSGLATGLAENSLEKGLLAGVTGFGLGSALGAAGAGTAGEVAKTAGQEVAKSAAKEGVRKAGEAATRELLSGAAESAMQGFPQAGLDAFGQSVAQSGPQTWGQVFQSGLSDLGNMGANLGDIGSAMMRPGPMLGITYGLGGIADLRAMDARKDRYKNLIDPSVAQGQRFGNTLTSSLSEVGRRYGFADGGITSVDPAGYQAMRADAIRFANGGSTALAGTPGQRQAALRGQFVNAPPEGYRPGIDPEFNYFSREALPTTVNPPAVDAMPQAPAAANPFAQVPQDVLNRYRQVARDLGNFHVQRDLSSRNTRNRQQYLPEFTSLRSQYPGLLSLDTELNIDPQYQSAGFDPVAGNLPGAMTQPMQGGIASLPALGMPGQFMGIQPMPQEIYMDRRSPRMMAQGGMSPEYDPMTGLTKEEQEELEEKRKFPGLLGSMLPFSPEDLPDPIKKYTLWGGLLSGEGVPNYLSKGTLLGRFMAEGGMTGGDDMVSEVVKAILGEHENGDAVISMFVEKHGPEVFAQLRSQVLQGVVPGAQTEGQMKGDGGGMDDRLMGMIGSSQPVALSTDEFVVPADVVSALGDGSSDAGAKVLYEMMDSVRRYKGGSTNQPPKMSPEKLEKIKLGRP